MSIVGIFLILWGLMLLVSQKYATYSLRKHQRRSLFGEYRNWSVRSYRYCNGFLALIIGSLLVLSTSPTSKQSIIQWPSINSNVKPVKASLQLNSKVPKSRKVVSGSDFVCTSSINAFNVDNPFVIIGQFKVGTHLTIGEKHSSGKFDVTYTPPSGSIIRALCDESDLLN
jgi:hypothetical protein